MKNSLLVFIAITCFSCQTTPVEMEVPQSPEKLVVATQYTNDGVLLLGLSRTFNVLKDVTIDVRDSAITIPEELMVNDAKVYIHFNNQKILLNPYVKGVYYTNQLPEVINGTYQLEIHTADNKQSISAQTRMQPKAVFDTLSILKPVGMNRYHFHYGFSQSESQPGKQFYLVTYLTKSNHNIQNQSGNYLERIAQSIMHPGTNFDLYSSDQFVNGKIVANKYFQTDIHDTVVVSLTNIHQDYFEFLKMFQRSKKLVNQLKGEPIHLHTNIVNGFGFFTLAPPDVRVLRVN